LFPDQDLSRFLTKFGYEIARQKGSHVRLRHKTDPSKTPVTVPMHDELAFGTLKRILRDAGMTVDQLNSDL
jgi:predicted RNA binding protein YcfA (HicA-like mRNA interferase family)